MPLGAVLLEFDLKMGPVFKLAVPSTLEVTQDETIILFTTRTMIDKGFTGITVKDRQWATYLNPPNLYCILLSPLEHQHDFEEPMENTFGKIEPDGNMNQAKLLELYNHIVYLTGEKLHQDLSKRPEVQRIIERLKKDPDALRPAWSFKTGYRYPVAEDITGKSDEETNELLNSMMSTGLLRGRICGNIVGCPVCNSHQVILHINCPKCGLPTLESGIGLEHFICNRTEFIEAFSTTSGLVCPQCKLHLAPGTYRTLGKVYHCLTCNSFLINPDHILGCVNCKHTFTPDKAKYTPIYSYTSVKL
ncbi:MAG: hypothetical protein ACFFBX_11035 [Promethearchaeota archaeon]